MGGWNSRHKWFQEDSDSKTHTEVSDKDCQETHGCLQPDLLCGVFPENYEGKGWVIDPRGTAACRWNRLFFAAIMASLFIDPLYCFSPRVHPELICIENEAFLDKTFTVLRSLNDVFYWVHILIQFRTAFVAPSSRVFGRGELIIDPCKIAFRYIRTTLWMDLLAALPIPQALVWAVIPYPDGSVTSDSNITLRFLILVQYLFRCYRLYQLLLHTVNATGVMNETAWLGAAYNLLLFYVASHISGAFWYLFIVERQEACWKSICDQETKPCGFNSFDCKMANDPRKMAWLMSSNVTTLCDPKTGAYQFGIYTIGITTGVPSSSFPYKYTYSLWIGLQALSSTGQSFITAIYVSENLYSLVVGSIGLILLAVLIANMQRYFQSTTARLEDWRLRKGEAEKWMDHRQLPSDLKHHVLEYYQHKWLATRGVNEEDLLSRFPTDLRRNIKRHLSLKHVQKVPLFGQMDSLTLDAVCERMRHSLYTPGTFLLQEGDLVNEIFFIIRGNLDSYTTNGGRDGFFNMTRIGQGGFCGEELLTWVLDPLQTTDTLPSSTRTVKAVSLVEAFGLSADDLKFMALQFRRLHSRAVRHAFRFYSEQWRTWAACYIQAAWKQFRRRKELSRLRAMESSSMERSSNGVTEEVDQEMDIFVPRPGAGIEVYAARLITNQRRERSKRYSAPSSAV